MGGLTDVEHSGVRSTSYISNERSPILLLRCSITECMLLLEQDQQDDRLS
jgi:hypothetical protein